MAIPQHLEIVDKMFELVEHINQELAQFKIELLQLKKNVQISPEEAYFNRFGEELHPDLIGLVGEFPETSLENDKSDVINSIMEKYDHENTGRY